MTSGKLRIHIIEAKLTRDTEMFGKMDPYAVLQCRESTYRTKVKDNAGKTPKWHEVWELDVKYVGDDLHIQVKDQDVTKSDDVGNTSLKLSSLCVGTGIDEWFDL